MLIVEEGRRKKEEGRRKKEEGRRQKEEERRKKEEDRRKKTEGRRKKEEGRRKKEEGRRKKKKERRKKKEGSLYVAIKTPTPSGEPESGRGIKQNGNYDKFPFMYAINLHLKMADYMQLQV